jgi:tetratricopeptide (TPR) repeat protein
MGEYRAALDEYDLAVGLSPGYTAARFDASRAEAAIGRFEDARRRLSEALVADPASFYGQLVRGEVEKAAGNAAGAREAFERALELNPGMSLAHYQLGQLAEARSDPGEARRHYERAIESDQDFVDARRALARLGR